MINRALFPLTVALILTLCLGTPSVLVHAADDTVHDVVIYGGTSAGIAAAVQVKRMGGSAVVIEPGTRIGGLTTGGLGQTDIGNKAAIGGIARELCVVGTAVARMSIEAKGAS